MLNVGAGVSTPDLVGELPRLRFAAGELVHQAGDPARCLFLLESGSVELTLPLPDGTEWRLIEVVDGELFGEVDVLEGSARTVHARAVTDCELRAMTLEQLEGWLEQRPKFALEAVAGMARRVRALEDRLRAVASQLAAQRAVGPTPARSAPDRSTARVLAEDCTEPDRAPANVTKNALARLVHRESGTELVLPAGSNLVIGRSSTDRQFQPDVDLAAFDRRRSVSRRHARLVKRQAEWWLHAESKAMNGTRVNGNLLPAGEEVKLQGGDVLTFGGLDFVLHEPPAILKLS